MAKTYIQLAVIGTMSNREEGMALSDMKLQIEGGDDRLEQAMIAFKAHLEAAVQSFIVATGGAVTLMPPKVKKPKVKKDVEAKPHVHDWKVFINHMTEAPEGRRCACGASEWF